MQRKILFLACFFVCAHCLGQQYPFVYYTPKDGLINSRVRTIKQDSKGRMYFITFGGLSVYDGAKFRNYSQQEGLAVDLVNDVVEVGPDSFWIATNTQKLNTLVKGKIGVFKTVDDYCPIVNRFLKSSEGDWYVAADEGFFLLSENRFVRIPLPDEDGIDIGNFLDKILEYKNYLLLSPWNYELKSTLLLYDKRAHKLVDIYTTEKVFNMVVDKTNRIWMATSDGIKLLDEEALRDGKIKLQSLPQSYRKILGNQVASVYFDREGNTWFYDSKWLLRVSPQFDQQRLSSEQGMKTASVADVFQDKEGIFWIASDGDGVIKWKGGDMQLLTSLSGKQPISITCLSRQGDTLWLYNKADKTVHYFYKNETRSFQLRTENISPTAIYAQGNQLYLMDPKKIIRVNNKNNPSAYDHPRIFRDSMTFLNMGGGITAPDGMVIYHTKKGDTSYYIGAIKNEKVIMEHRISFTTDQMTIDRQGRLWVVTRNNHLMVFALHPETPSKYFEFIKDYHEELPDLNPRSVTADKNNNIWIGTRYLGLYRLEFDGLKIRSMTQYTTKNGLTDNFIYSLYCDINNIIWIGTQTGLDKISEKKGQYIIGNISKTNNQFQLIHKIIATSDNIIWALSGEGSVLKISPSVFTNSTYTPQLLLTSIRVNNKDQPDSLSSFSYRQNNFSFTVAAPSYIDERSITYSYLLEGSGIHTWSQPSNDVNFNFINLSAGHYKLNVRANFPEAVYPSQNISYAFTILPPWWQTWWFRIPFGIFILAIAVWLVRFYYRRKLQKQLVELEKQQAVEKERTRIATDMHDDLGAGLSRIKFLSETIGIKKQQQQPIEEDINKIKEYSHEMIDKMGEIVWALNEKNDSLSDLLSYTRSYAMEYLSQNGIDCKVHAPETLPGGFVSGEFRRNIFLSVKETLHNIVKHARASRVNISMQIDNNLAINIEDDGIGFDRTNIRPYSNGLTNMEKRMKDIGGILEIKNSKGTTVRLKAPLPS